MDGRQRSAWIEDLEELLNGSVRENIDVVKNIVRLFIVEDKMTARFICVR